MEKVQCSCSSKVIHTATICYGRTMCLEWFWTSDMKGLNPCKNINTGIKKTLQNAINAFIIISSSPCCVFVQFCNTDVLCLPFGVEIRVWLTTSIKKVIRSTQAGLSAALRGKVNKLATGGQRACFTQGTNDHGGQIEGMQQHTGTHAQAGKLKHKLHWRPRITYFKPR